MFNKLLFNYLKKLKMGIKDLNAFVIKRCPSAFRIVEMRKFRNRRIAIDSNLYLYRILSSAYTNVLNNKVKDREDLILDEKIFWDKKNPESYYYNHVKAIVENTLKNFIFNFYKHGIVPVFIFDGVSGEALIKEKNEYARAERKKVKENAEAKIKLAKDEIKNVDLKDFKQLDDLYAKVKNVLRQKPPIDYKLDFDFIKEYLINAMKADIIVAPNEAEKYCCYLNRVGYVAGVWSLDTDCFPFGAKIIILGNNDFKSDYFNVVIPDMIYESLNLSHAQFVDMTIVFSNDFNLRIPKLGPETIWKNINKDKEDIIKDLEEKFKEKDFSCLNRESCRKIFLDYSDCSNQKFEKLELKSSTSDKRMPDYMYKIYKENIKNKQVKDTLFYS